jgi:SRSO17 transposase
MKSLHDITSQPVEPTLPQIAQWPLALQQLHHRIAACFARPEPRQHALLYLQAILSDIPRKNGWQIAEHAHHAHPYRMQRLLSRAVWDEDGVRDELRAFVAQTLQPACPSAPATSPFPVLILDESGFPKRGRHSAGVQPQYCGLTGRVENCQVGVFLSYVTERGHGLIDRELYLPLDWCQDHARRQGVHIPETVSFQTKPQLAQRMVERAVQAGLPIAWVVADSVYGHSTDLRLFLEERGLPYALAVPCTEVVCVATPSGPRLADVAHLAADLLEPTDWQRLSASRGTKGERLFDWAILPVFHQGRLDGRHFLVFRRSLDDASQITFYLVWTLPDTPLPTIVQAIGARWHIEEDLETNKDLGLDHYEVRSYVGWYRHVTLVLLAAAFLLAVCVQTNPPPPPSAPEADPHLTPARALIALTPSEVRHLLARLFWPAPTSAPFICHWSRFRRSHQYWAGYYHRRRRAKTASP